MSLRSLIVLVAIGAVFFFASSSELPPRVASHFVVGGTANGFMPKGAYISFMAIMVLGLPLLIGCLLGLGRYLPAAFINLPNRSYWLSPERIEATRQYIGRQGGMFAAFLLIFLCFVHWQVVQANFVHPPRLSERLFLFGLVLFAVATAVWGGAFVVHFRRVRP